MDDLESGASAPLFVRQHIKQSVLQNSKAGKSPCGEIMDRITHGMDREIESGRTANDAIRWRSSHPAGYGLKVISLGLLKTS
jgi:hypothetical protein